MPTPPVIPDPNCSVVGGPAIGTSPWYQSWGKLRFPLGINGSTVVTAGANCVDYSAGFTTADGSLFRHDYGSEPGFLTYPSEFFYADTLGPPPAGFFYMGTYSSLYTGVGPFMDKDDFAQLLGETVTMTSGSFSLGTDAWTSPPGSQSVAASLGSISSIGKLATF